MVGWVDARGPYAFETAARVWAEALMSLKAKVAAGQARWRMLTVYEKFEDGIIFVLTGLIAVVIVASVWSLMIKILFSLVLSGSFDATDPGVFQSVFGMIFTVIIAPEFKRSLLLVAERTHSVVQLRAVLLLAMLAIVRKLIILDLAVTEAAQLFALAAAILSLGGVYWLVRDQDRRGRVQPSVDRAPAPD
jgi:uncharacterized membrane protein (DUF373 family)